MICFSVSSTSDVVTIDKTAENFRLLYDVKGRFTVHRMMTEEAKVCSFQTTIHVEVVPSTQHIHTRMHARTHAHTHAHTLQYKLGKVRRVALGQKGIPYCVTHDGRTIRYPDPNIKVNDSVRIDIASGKITDIIKFDVGNLCMVTGGRNLGRVGVITNRERHHGSFDIIHVKDSLGHTFATRFTNVFVIGKGNKAMVSLPRNKGVRLTTAEERDRRIEAKQVA